MNQAEEFKRLRKFLFLLPLLAAGCVYSLQGHSVPTNLKLQIRVAHPTNYFARVKIPEYSTNYTFDADGKVSFEVPRFENGCNVYLFGLVKIREGDPRRVRIIEVREKVGRINRVATELSLEQIDELGFREGYRYLGRVEE
jgi:hypothetical protein